MIFSHVLYQLSYLAREKKPPEPLVRLGRGIAAERAPFQGPPPLAPASGLHVSDARKLGIEFSVGW